MNRNIQKHHGFTLLEVIAVLVVMGIITAIALSRFSIISPDLMARTEILKSHLRYAQSRALNTNAVWGIRFSNAAYWLFNNGSINNRVALPGEDSNSVTLPSGMSAGTGIVSFDSWGRPCTDQAGQTIQSGDRTITISCGGDSKTATITQNTGFIP